MNNPFKNELCYYDEENDIHIVNGRPITMSDISNRDIAHLIRAGGDACYSAGIEWTDVLEWAADALWFSNEPCTTLFDY